MDIFQLTRELGGTRVLCESEEIWGQQIEKRLEVEAPSPALADLTLPNGFRFEIVKDAHRWADYTEFFTTIRDISTRVCYNVPTKALKERMVKST